MALDAVGVVVHDGVMKRRPGHSVTTVRIEPEQREWLIGKAAREAVRGGGRVNVSEVLRGVLQEAMDRDHAEPADEDDG